MAPNSLHDGIEPMHRLMWELYNQWHIVKKSCPNSITVKSKDHNAQSYAFLHTNEPSEDMIIRLISNMKSLIDGKMQTYPAVSAITKVYEYFNEWNIWSWSVIGMINRVHSLSLDDSGVSLKEMPMYERNHITSELSDTVRNIILKIYPPQWELDQKFSELTSSSFSKFNHAYFELYGYIDNYIPYKTLHMPHIDMPTFDNRIESLQHYANCMLDTYRVFCKIYCEKAWELLKRKQIENLTTYPNIKNKFNADLSSFYCHTLYYFAAVCVKLIAFKWKLNDMNSRAEHRNIINSILVQIYNMTERVLLDSIVCNEPVSSPILVTNNLFPMSIDSLCHTMLYREFNIQIISEETAQQIQGELRRRKKQDQTLTSLGFFRSAALLAMKPSTGVKRNNAVASAEGGNTAHKKSDVNSKEYIAINPSFDSNDNTWSAVYPHLLCTTRQKDTVIDSRISLQTGKRPLFYFHVIGKLYSPSGQIMTVHNLSLPFTIATRRNQDCQVQRMMSSYTATCFWLYGTFTLDGLALNWNDNGIDWSHFKMLYSNYFKLNAEVKRTIIDSDYKVLEGKIKCMECFDQWNRYDYVNNITFKNVLCPHLRYDIGNSNIVKFSVWRGMLELLHLFNDSKTDVITLWEKFIIYGFIDIHDIEFLLSSCDSIILIHLSFVIGSCVCVVVKTGNRIVLLEPLDLKKLQSKGLLEYLKDIVSTENIKYVYTAKGIRDVQSVFKDLKINFQDEHSYENSVKTISSNIAFSGNTEKLSMICFTNLKVAVIPCRPLKLNNNNNFNDSMATYNNYQQPNEYKDQSYSNSISQHLKSNLPSEHIMSDIIKSENLHNNQMLYNSPYNQGMMSQSSPSIIKTPNTSPPLNNYKYNNSNMQNVSFENQLNALLKSYGKTSNDAIAYLSSSYPLQALQDMNDFQNINAPYVGKNEIFDPNRSQPITLDANYYPPASSNMHPKTEISNRLFDNSQGLNYIPQHQNPINNNTNSYNLQYQNFNSQNPNEFYDTHYQNNVYSA